MPNLNRRSKIYMANALKNSAPPLLRAYTLKTLNILG